MYERLDECPLCKSTAFKNHMICKDYSVSQESFAMVKCAHCKLLFTNPRPDEGNLYKYYQSENYISHTNKSNNPVNSIYKVARYFTINRKIKLVSKFHKNGNLLDFGCGTGEFLKTGKKKGWNVTGYEPTKDAYEGMDQSIKSDIVSSLDEIQLKKHFHVITLWHVLEHISDLRTTIQQLKKMLRPDGVLVIAVPNHESYDAEYYKEYWAAYDLPRHLYHFSQQTMKSLLSANKLKLIKTYPMPLDAYYVSLLSEKYKTGRTNYIDAFSMGLKSNKAAKQNGNNYSSLIYIATK